MPHWMPLTTEQANEMYGFLGFTVYEIIGSGTFKQVFRADYRGSEIALKIMRLQGGQIEQRNRREIELMHEINSPYVAKVIDFNFGGLNYEPYVAEEYISGKSLDKWLKEDNLTLQNLLKIMDDIFKALLECASRNIVHRDVKPQNILIRANQDAVLTDFGLARPLNESTITASGITIGTVAYAPPEFIRYKSNQISQTSDLFSLGIMAYWILTATHPFIHVDDIPYDIQMLENKAVPAHEIDNSIPIELSKFIMKLIRREPLDRYSSTHRAYTKFRKIYSGLVS